MLPLIAIGLMVLLGFQCWWMSVQSPHAVAYVNPDADTLTPTTDPVVQVDPVPVAPVDTDVDTNAADAGQQQE